MRLLGDRLLFSPHDLLNFVDCPYVSWMDRLHLEHPGVYTVDAPSEFVGTIQAAGIDHEKVFLEELRSQSGSVFDLTDTRDCRATLAAMKEGHAVLYQPRLDFAEFSGIADFLVRVEGDSQLGSFHYEVWDTKLAREPKPHYLIQLCCYAEMLEALQGIRPKQVSVVDRAKQRRAFNTDEFFYYYLELKNAFLRFHKTFDPNVAPFITGNEDFGRWESHVRSKLEAEDALCRVANISGIQIRKLLDCGVKTMSDLAARKSPVRKMADAALQKLRLQAELQIESAGNPVPEYRLVPPSESNPRRGFALLPPASAGDIYFDIEGFPLFEGGLEYLLGACFGQKENREYRAWWAHSRNEEQVAFESFICWAYARWQEDRTAHIYHYAPYETSALERLVRVHHYGCGDMLDELLRNEVFVDLYQIVRQSMMVGEPRYSLKNIEHLYREKRAGEVTTAGDSVVEYARWIDSGESPDPEISSILRGIRDYNRVDCESTAELANWLWTLQANDGPEYILPKSVDGPETEPRVPTPAEFLATQMLAELPSGIELTQVQRLQQLLAYLLQFHRREEKPMWWEYFKRLRSSDQELVDDIGCLGSLVRTAKERFTVPRGRSFLYEYRFDPEQDTKLEEGSRCVLTHNECKTTIKSLNLDQGLVTIALTKELDEPPASINLIPYERVSAKAIEDSILATVLHWRDTGTLPPALSDLLLRNRPRINGIAEGSPLVLEGEDLVAATTRIVHSMNSTTLCIQGPPGTGKTYTAARAIVSLVKDGKRVGISANSHNAILNLENEVASFAGQCGLRVRGMHVGDRVDSDDLPAGFQSGKLSTENLPDVVGGTAWAFSDPRIQGQISHLFIDEAGQVSLANIAGMSRATKNIVLIGDQMQLSQPTRAVHPGDSGLSALDYLLNGHSTIPGDLGIFLDTSRRMHPDVCQFVSDTSYDGRLRPHDSTSARYLLLGDGKHIRKPAGLLFKSVPHEGNRQCSDEEADHICELVAELTGNTVLFHTAEGDHSLTVEDILVIAPYNLQVGRIREKLSGIRVASVDKFQGQEAPVVIYSMAASSGNDCPRGIDFLFSRNRTNVAISRAKSLAIVVGSPDLCRTSCNSIDQMRLVNLYCRIVHAGCHDQASKPIS